MYDDQWWPGVTSDDYWDLCQVTGVRDETDSGPGQVHGVTRVNTVASVQG